MQDGHVARHTQRRIAVYQNLLASVERKDFVVDSDLVAAEDVETFSSIEQFACRAQIADKVAALSCEVQLELEVRQTGVIGQINLRLIPAAAQIDNVITNLGGWSVAVIVIIVIIRQIVVQVGSQHNPLSVGGCEHCCHGIVSLRIYLASNSCCVLTNQLGSQRIRTADIDSERVVNLA